MEFTKEDSLKNVQKLVQSCLKFLVLVFICWLKFIPKIYKAFIIMSGVYKRSFTKKCSKLSTIMPQIFSTGF